MAWICIYVRISISSENHKRNILRDYRVVWTHLLLLIKVLGKSTFLQKIAHHFSALCINGQVQASATIVVLFELLAKQRKEVLYHFKVPSTSSKVECIPTMAIILIVQDRKEYIRTASTIDVLIRMYVHIYSSYNRHRQLAVLASFSILYT